MNMTGDEAMQALTEAASAAVIAKPGDTLIIGFSGHLDADTASKAAAVLRERLPDIEICLVDQVAAFAVVTKE